MQGIQRNHKLCKKKQTKVKPKYVNDHNSFSLNKENFQVVFMLNECVVTVLPTL